VQYVVICLAVMSRRYAATSPVHQSSVTSQITCYLMSAQSTGARDVTSTSFSKAITWDCLSLGLRTDICLERLSYLVIIISLWL